MSKKNIQQSVQLFHRAQQTIPGGVNSPVRAFKSVGGTPLFFQSASGAILKDADDNEYIDYVGSWGPMILGHAYPKVVAAIQQTVENGTSFGAPTELEIQLAELIVQMVPNIDKVRMVNSGTEACMSAIRLARGYTGRDKIIKFEGCYHGHADSFLIKAGSGAATLGMPSSPGVTKATAQDTLTASYNNLKQVEELVQKNHRQIAAIIVEPVAGNMGCVLPQKGFLEELRKLCDMENILLIFDEVMTGFRLAKGGAQELLDIKADIVTFGKIIGGGLPVGAYAAQKEIMDYVAPVGPVYQAGTLSGNPVAMIAGYTLLKELNDYPNIYNQLEAKTLHLKSQIANRKSQIQINQIGSMMSLHFTDEPVIDFETAKTGDNDTFKKFFHHLLNHGIYIPPSAYESWFLSNALTYEQLNKTVEVINKFLKEKI
jgi:glutamate-1-semialdehyde 2,1-aminomutase